MKVLLIGERYSENLGDGVIFETFSGIYKKIYPNSIIKELDVSGRTAYREEYNYKSNSRPFEKLKNTLKKILPDKLAGKISAIIRINNLHKNMNEINFKEYNYAIFVGGSLFMDYFAFPIYLIIRKLSNYNVHVIFNCCGLGKCRGKINQYLLRYSINNKVVIGISIRDNLEYFKKIYLKRNDIKIEKTLDAAFELKDYYNIDSDFVKKDKIVGIGIMSIADINKNGYVVINEENYIKMLRTIIIYLDNDNYEWAFFTNGAIQDHVYAEYLCEKLNCTEKLCKRPTKPIELIDTINKFQKIVSFRLHSHIIATSLGVPVVGFVCGEKVKEFASIINNPYFINLMNNNIQEQLEVSLDWLIKHDAKISLPNCITTTSEYIRSLQLNEKSLLDDT